MLSRYIPIILQLMIASSLVNKKSYHQDKYTIAIDKPYFVCITHHIYRFTKWFDIYSSTITWSYLNFNFIK